MYGIVPTIQPFNSRNNPINDIWAKEILADPILLESILFHAAVDLDRTHQRPWSPVTLYHRGRAIRLVNEHLASTDEVPSDAVIGAVGFLGSAGVSTLLPLESFVLI